MTFLLIITDLTVSWKCHRPKKHKYNGKKRNGKRHVRIKNNSNKAIGHFNNSQVNMNNEGCGNVQANSKHVHGGHNL